MIVAGHYLRAYFVPKAFSIGKFEVNCYVLTHLYSKIMDLDVKSF